MAEDGELIAGRYYISPVQRSKLTPEQYAKLRRPLEDDAPVDDFLEELQQRAEDGSVSTGELQHWVIELDRLRAASARGSDV